MRRTTWADLADAIDERAAVRREVKRRKTAEARRKALARKQKSQPQVAHASASDDVRK